MKSHFCYIFKKKKKKKAINQFIKLLFANISSAFHKFQTENKFAESTQKTYQLG